MVAATAVEMETVTSAVAVVACLGRRSKKECVTIEITARKKATSWEGGEITTPKYLKHLQTEQTMLSRANRVESTYRANVRGSILITETEAPAMSKDVMKGPQNTLSTLAPLPLRLDAARRAMSRSSIGGVAPRELTRTATRWSGDRGR